MSNIYLSEIADERPSGSTAAMIAATITTTAGIMITTTVAIGVESIGTTSSQPPPLQTWKCAALNGCGQIASPEANSD